MTVFMVSYLPKIATQLCYVQPMMYLCLHITCFLDSPAQPLTKCLNMVAIRTGEEYVLSTFPFQLLRNEKNK